MKPTSKIVPEAHKHTELSLESKMYILHPPSPKMSTTTFSQEESILAETVAQLAECLPTMHEALGSILSTAYKRAQGHTPVIWALGKWRLED